jgi:hypothetical protein
VITIFTGQFHEKFHLLKRTQITSYSYQFAGKSIPTRNLGDDLNDFLALVPVDKLLEIALDYLSNDEQVQNAVVYLQGEEFHTIVLTIEGLQETKNVSALM